MPLYRLSDDSASLSRFWRHCFFALWAVGCATVISLLMVGHLAAFEAPEQGVRFTDDVDRAENWEVSHILAAECDCSQAVGTYLAERGVAAGYLETVLVLGDDPALVASLRSAGFRVETVGAEAGADRFGVDVAPFFQVWDQARALLHSGGYTWCADRTRQDFVDLSVVARLANDDPIAAAPVFGCATSATLQSLVDPLSLKY